MIVVFNAAALSPNIGLYVAKVRVSRRKEKIVYQREVTVDVGSEKTDGEVFLAVVDTNDRDGIPIESYRVQVENSQLLIANKPISSGESIDGIRVTFNKEIG